METTTERNVVKEFYVETTIKFTGTIQAESEAEAEKIGYYYDNLEYECVDRIDVELITDYEDEDEE